MDNTIGVSTETVVGSHVLTIDGYTKTTAALAVGESIKSEIFRVGGHGWSIMCLPRGNDDPDWVSVHLWIHGGGGGAADGNHEVKASYKFVMLDGDGEEILSYGSHEPETFSLAYGRAAWGTDEFIQRKTLESYLIIQDDDRCRIRCDVAVVKEPPAVQHPSPERRLGDLLLATEVGRDVTFLVGGEQFTAHKCVLAARSSSTAFMEEVVLGTGKETAIGGSGVGSGHVRVDGMAPTVFKALLHFIYTDSLPAGLAADDRIAVVQGLLAEAERYDMARLKLICTDLLLVTEVGRDVTFAVDGEVFTAHLCVLAARSSPAFMAMVGTGKEESADGCRHVRVVGVVPRAFKALLHFIYTDSVPHHHGIDRDQLLEAAHRYGMERLKTVCADLMCSDINASTALHTLKLATRFRCLKLNQACVMFIKGMLDAFNLEETK